MQWPKFSIVGLVQQKQKVTPVCVVFDSYGVQTKEPQHLIFLIASCVMNAGVRVEPGGDDVVIDVLILQLYHASNDHLNIYMRTKKQMNFSGNRMEEMV